MEKKMMPIGSMWVLVVLGLITNPVNADICSDTLTKLLPCQPFVIGIANDISAPCCEGAQSINQLASSKENLKSICECLKQIATIPGLNIDRVKQIPKLCKITTPLPLDPNVNCNKA